VAATVSRCGLAILSPRDWCSFCGLASASTPLGAGIAALVLQANPKISWLDFQYILKLSAYKTGTTSTFSLVPFPLPVPTRFHHQLSDHSAPTFPPPPAATQRPPSNTTSRIRLAVSCGTTQSPPSSASDSNSLC
jgi:hypothetical protein